MALQATVYRFVVELSHVDRGVYETLDIRIARHPSETERSLLARVLAWAHLWPGDPALVLAPSKGGLSAPDEPALSIHTIDGRLMCWVDIGTPSAERLHKASKAAPRVVVVTQHDPKLLQDDVARHKVHKVEEIEVLALDPAFLDALAAQMGPRGVPLSLTVSEDQLYITMNGTSHAGAWRRVPLGPS